MACWLCAVSAWAANLHVELTTQWGDRQRFIDGDEIRLLVSLNQDAYVLLYYQDAANRISQLYPNAYEKSGFQKKGLYLPLAGQPAPFRLKVTAPYGKERFFLFASDQPLAGAVQEPVSDGKHSATIESIQQVLQNRTRASKAQLQRADLTVQTAPR